MIKIYSVLFLLFCSIGFAKSSPLKKADALSVKASLENMLVRRYTQELSSIVDKEHFNIGVILNLRVVNTNERRPQNLEFNDLELGFLDADALFDSYSLTNMAGANPFEKYSIRGADFQIGLSPEVGDEIKASVEQWLSKRVKNEFGSGGKTKVQYLLSPPEAAPVVETPVMKWMKIIKDMQGLAGNIVLAFAIILGIVLWSVLGGGKTEAATDTANSSQSIEINSKTEMGGAFGGSTGTVVDSELEASIVTQLDHMKEQIKDLAPKVVDQLDSLITEWCDQGEEGLFLLASFAEISGSVLGSLPIPKDEKKKMSSIFAQMHETENSRKLEFFNRVYWDLISALNLGTESLHRPFSFLGNSGMSTLSNVLLGNDLETQTVISLYMPEKMRKKYFAGLDDEKRIELLNAAAKMSSITEESLQSIEDHVAPYFGESDSEESSVPMDMTLVKLVESMGFVDSCRILPSIEGPVMDKFKLQTAHIGFLASWDKSAIGVIAKYASNEALLAYLRVVPEMKHYVLEFVPPRTQQILEDDLGQLDTMSPERKEDLLAVLHDLILSLVDNGELSLDELVENADNDSNEDLDIAA